MKESFRIKELPTVRPKLKNVFRTVIDVNKYLPIEEAPSSGRNDEVDSNDFKIDLTAEPLKETEALTQSDERVFGKTMHIDADAVKSLQADSKTESDNIAQEYEQSDSETVIEQEDNLNLKIKCDSEILNEFEEGSLIADEKLSANQNKEAVYGETISENTSQTVVNSAIQFHNDIKSYVSNIVTQIMDQHNESNATQREPLDHSTEEKSQEEGASILDEKYPKEENSLREKNTSGDEIESIENDEPIEAIRSQSAIQEMERNIAAYKQDYLSDKLEDLTVEQLNYPLSSNPAIITYSPELKVKLKSVNEYCVFDEPNEVIISHINNPKHFYVQPIKFLDRIPCLEREFLEEIKSSRPADKFLWNALYFIKIVQTDRWYRGKIIGAGDNCDVWIVFYVDYGYQEKVHSSRLSIDLLLLLLLFCFRF